MENMTVDPLKILIDISSIRLIKDKTMSRIFYSIYLFIQIAFILAGIAEGIHHGEHKIAFYMGIIVFLPSCSMCVTAILYALKTAQNDRVIFKYGFSIESGGSEMKKKIMDDVKKIKYFCFVSLVISLIAGLLLSPLNGDEDTFMFQYILMKKWFGKIGVIGFINSLIFGVITSHYLMSCVWLTAHMVYHVKFQFLLLIAYLETESTKCMDPNIDSNIVNDEERQRHIHEVLRNCMKQYLRIKKWTRCSRVLWALHGFFVPTNKVIENDMHGKSLTIKLTIRDSQLSFLYIAKPSKKWRADKLSAIQEVDSAFIFTIGEDISKIEEIHTYFDGIKYKFSI